MKFHTGKCKVLPIAPPGKGLRDLFNKIYPLNYIYYYHLGDEELEYVESEKDLGVYVTANLSWDNHIDFLYSKASSRLGLLKRALHFVKCPKQKRVFFQFFSSEKVVFLNKKQAFLKILLWLLSPKFSGRFSEKRFLFFRFFTFFENPLIIVLF